MKIATSFLAALLFTATLGALNNAIAQDSILSKGDATAANNRHENVSTIQPNTPSKEVPTPDSAKTDRSDPWYGFTSTDWGYRNPQ